MKRPCIDRADVTKASLLNLLLVAALGWGVLPLSAIEREWKPGLSNNQWSNPNNWDPAGIPQNGDALAFLGDGLLGQTGTMVNDLVDLTVSSLTFGEYQAGGETEWNLSGNTLTISQGIFLASENATPVSIHCGLVLAQNATFSVSFYSTEDLHVTGPIDLNGHTLSLTPEMDTSVDLSGVISGNGSLSLRLSGPQFGGGTAKLSGPEANTFVGTVTSVSREASYVALPGHLLGVRLELDKQSEPAVPGSLILGTNCSAILKRSHQIADNSTVTIRAGGRLLLEGNTETIGSLNFLGGRNGDWAYGALETLVDTGGATLSVLGNITSDHRYTNNMPTIKGRLGLPPGHHSIIVSGDQFYGLDIHAQILGDGGFTKSGPSALLLQGNNIFNGELTVTEGILEARHANALGSVAGFTILSNNATLLLNDVGIFGESLFVRGNLAFSADTAGSWLEAVGMNVWSGPIILDTNLVLTGFNGGMVNFNGLISGPGGLHCLSGTIELSGTEANTFTGTTLARNPLLLANKSSGVAAFGGPLVVGSALGSPSEVRWLGAYQRLYGSVTLFEGAYVNLNDHNDDFGPITFNGGTISTGTGELGVYGLVMANAASSTPTIDGRLGLPPGLHEFRVSEGSPLPDLRINASVIGAGSLRKTGPGQMWLTAPNSYAGLTTVAEGTLSILNPDALGGFSSGTTVNEGATLDLNAVSGTVREPLALRGTGDSGLGALNAFGIVTLRNPTPSVFAAIDLTAATTIRVGPGSLLTVEGFISGLGPLTKIGAGTLLFINANENTYSGDTVIREGTLDLGKPNNVISVPGNLVLGPATAASPASARWFQTGPMNANSLVTVNARSLLDLNGFDQTLARLNLNDGGSAQTGAGRLNLTSGGIVQVGSLSPFGSHVTASIAGRIGLPANNYVSFNVVPFADFPPFAGGPELDVPALISVNGFESPSFDPAGFSKGSLGWMRLSANNTYRGVTYIDGGTLQVEGSQPQSTAQINNGGRLLGSGTIGHVDFSGSSGVIAPGTSPGILTTSNFNAGANAGGVLQIELNGTARGSGYDQLNVRGTVRLLGISLNGSLNFPSAVGHEFTIINNDGSDGVIGTFNGLPQNANVYIGGEQFTISYTGGTGNDVVLTRVFTPPRPVLKIATIGTNLVRLLWATNDPAYRLEFRTNLTAANWMPASDPQVIVGTNYVVTNATSGIESLSVLTPVAWYRLGEHDPGAAAGLAVTNTTDSAGAKHLKQFGNPLYTGAVSPDAATQVASSLGVQLNGSGQYFRNDFLTPVVNNFGIEAWVKPNTVSSTYHFVAYNGNTAGDGWGIAWQGGAFKGWYGNVVLFGSGGVTPGMWAHVALVRDGGFSTLYLNGVPASNPTGFGPNTPTGGFALGIRPQAPTSEFFNGAIDEVRVFTFAPGQFTTNDLLLNQPFTQTTNPPVRFYRLFKP